MDVDGIISVVALALVALIGANTWLLLSVRDRVDSDWSFGSGADQSQRANSSNVGQDEADQQ